MSIQKTVLVIGANGQLGKSLLSHDSKYSHLTLVAVDKDECDITNQHSVSQVTKTVKPDYVINAAAYTAVDKAETDKDNCYAVNAYALHNIINCLGKAKFIHISSDYVYHNNPGRPLKESDSKEPRGVYAKSKLLGDQIVEESNVDWMILRSSWIYSPYGHNFVKTIIRLLTERSELKVVNDQIGAPTSALDLAEAILEIMSQDTQAKLPTNTWRQVYNYANAGRTSWYDIAVAVKNHVKSDTIIHAIPTFLYPTPAARPLWSVMDLHKIRQTFSLDIPKWDKSLKKCLDLIPN